MAVNSLNEPFRGRPFNTDNRRQCFYVAIVNDDVSEDAESFTVTISNSVPSPSVLVVPDVVTITILDTDSKWDLRRVKDNRILKSECRLTKKIKYSNSLIPRIGTEGITLNPHNY